MDIRRILLTTLVVLVFVSACALIIRLPLIQESVQAGLILPILYLIWLLGLVLRSIDQQSLWIGGLIIISLLLVYGLTVAWPSLPERRRRTRPEEEQPPPVYGRVNYWQNKIVTLRNQGVDSEYANYDFRRLSQDVIGTTAGPFIPPAPPEGIAVFLKRGEGRDVPVDKPARWRGSPSQGQAVGPDPLSELCNYLEDQLEIEHDTNH